MKLEVAVHFVASFRYCWFTQNHTGPTSYPSNHDPIEMQRLGCVRAQPTTR